ncbi:NADPH-dependent FMN reductase [Georgenia sp. Z1344]|uniref:NADPH-dependent FMN reductase n=1 Tax=Georgenia sp. Z1344 TaxID=3416706 RepID=UPI003CF95585
MLRIAIIVGTTRPGRRGDIVARWVHAHASGRGDASYELVDLADHRLPVLDEPVAAAMSEEYVHAHTRRWAATIASYDGFVFVTPEYNHSTTAALKNALDYLYREWHDKACGFVSYGINGGVRAVEHLRQIVGELHLADVRDQVALSAFDDFDGSRLDPPQHHLDTLHRMLDQLTAWADALRKARTAADAA